MADDIKKLAQDLLGSGSQEQIAAANPYYRFAAVPETVNKAAIGAFAAQDPEDRDLGELTGALAISSLLGGTLRGFGDEYQGKLTSRYNEMVNQIRAGTPETELRDSKLPESLFAKALQTGNLFKVTDELRKQERREALEDLALEEQIKTSNQLKKDIVAAILDDSYTADAKIAKLREYAGVSPVISEGIKQATDMNVFAKPASTGLMPTPAPEATVEFGGADTFDIEPLEKRRMDRIMQYRRSGLGEERAVLAANKDFEAEMSAEKDSYELVQEQRQKARELESMANATDHALDMGLETGGGAQLGQWYAKYRDYLPFNDVLGLGEEREAAGNMLDSIKSKVIAMGRVVGSGQTSDFEAKAFLASGPTLDKSVAANREIAQRLRDIAVRNRDYADFVDEVRGRGGTIRQANELWAKYEQAVPLWVQEEGKYGRRENITPWREFNFATGEIIKSKKGEVKTEEPPEKGDDTALMFMPAKDETPGVSEEYLRGIGDLPANVAAMVEPETYKAMVTDEGGDFSAEQTLRTIGSGAAMTAGAAKGGAMGAVGGPVGAFVGAGIGAGLGWLAYKQAEDAVTKGDTLIPTKEEVNQAARIAGGATGMGVFAKGAGNVAGKVGRGAGKFRRAAADKVSSIKGRGIAGLDDAQITRSAKVGKKYYDADGNILGLDQMDDAAQMKTKLERSVEIVDDDGFFKQATNSPKENEVLLAQKKAQAGADVATAHDAIKAKMQQSYDSLGPVQKKQYPLTKQPSGKGGLDPDFSKARARVAEIKRADANVGATAEKYLNREIANWNRTDKSYDTALAKKRAYGEQVNWNKAKDSKTAAKQAVQKELHNSFNDTLNTIADFHGVDLKGANAKFSAYSNLEPAITKFSIKGTPGVLEGSGIFDRLVGAPGRAAAKVPKQILGGAERVSKVADVVTPGMETFGNALDAAIGKLGSGSAVIGGATERYRKKKVSEPIDMGIREDQDESVEAPDSDRGGLSLKQAVAKVESNNNPKAIGPQTKYGKAKGKFQFLDTTGKWILRDKLKSDEKYDPFNETQQERIYDWYMGYLTDKFNDPKIALAAYNWGEGKVKRALRGSSDYADLEPKLPVETRRYVSDIMELING